MELIEYIANNSNVKDQATSKDRPVTSGGGAGVFVIDDPRAVRVLASPIRQEIVDAFVAAGPSSIAEVARHLGRASDSLYFHVRRLVSVGLLVEKEPRREGRHVAAVYDVPGRPMRIAYGGALGRGSGRRAVGSVVQGAVRLGARDFARASERGDACVTGPHRELWGGRAKGWVDEAGLEELNALIERASAILHAGRPGKGRRAVSFTFILAPVRTSVRAPGADGSSRSGRTTTKGPKR